MYQVSEHYRSAINNSNPSYLTGMITFKDGSTKELTMADIAVGGTSITMQAVTQDVLEFGAAILGQLDISIITPKNESRYKYYDAVINLDFNIETDGGIEIIPLGEYIITEADRDKNALKLCAYDNLFKMDKTYDLSLVGMPYELMLLFAEHCGCELAEDEEYYKSLPNGDMTVTVTPGSGCATYRQACTVIAQTCGGFIQADRYGKISLKRFSTTPTFTLEPSQRYSSSIADYVCEYVDLVATGLAGSFRAVAENVDVGMTMYLDDAPGWDEGTEATLQPKADNLMAYLENIKYTPSDLVIISDPSIDCGDLVTLVTDTGTANTLITSYTWNFHGQMELHSVGKNPYLLSNSINKQRTIRDLEMSGGATEKPAAIYIFKNAKIFKCIDRLESLAVVTFVATRDTFAMFDATFQVTVDVDDITTTSSFTLLNADGTTTTYEVPYNRSGEVNITIQYYYNFVKYGTPYTLTLKKGNHVITLHYPINNIDKDSINRFEVFMSSDGGTVKVPKEGFLGTISGQGLAGKPKWDGTITVEESINFVSTYTMDVAKYNDQVNITKPIRDHGSDMLSDRVRPVSTYTMGVLGFEGSFGGSSSTGFDMVITNYTFEPAKKSIYEFDREVVQVDDAYRLRMEYTYESTEKNINLGALASVVINTTNKSVIESVVIE